jgi:predicted TIM-barrel fold metal-dependent hydrolase
VKVQPLTESHWEGVMPELDDRYLVISSDCHAGAPIRAYREYLEGRYHDEFDAWEAAFVNPFPDLVDPASCEYRRNFDSAIRQQDLESDGVVGEVVYPNTIPPFFPSSTLTLPDCRPEDYELRWAGIRAHNRWLADFCAELPGRRAGVAQLLVNDVDDAVAEAEWVRDAGLFGGVMIPNVSPDSHLLPLHAPVYEPLWDACEALGLPINLHGGTGAPDLGPYPATPALLFVEYGWYAQRPFVRFLFAGVFERHPDLTFVMTEQGSSWVPALLAGLDWAVDRMRNVPGSVEDRMGGELARGLSLMPSEYWARQCFLGASFMGPVDCSVRAETNVDTIMWGSDYPHSEGTFPYTMEAMRHTFAGVDPDEVGRMLGRNAARAYRFDLDVLEPVAQRIGPRVADVSRPLEPDEFPVDALTAALDRIGKPVGNIS